MVEYSYDPRGRQTEVKFADNSQSITHSYNAVGQITVTDTVIPGGFSGNKTKLIYTYDEVGNRKSIKHENKGTRTFNYAYDMSSRMTSVKRVSSLLATYS
ncbi:MAG: hypothetical protein IID52_09255, partial [Proteobacteria bacterium]|nr:hypothetical protein [Pseudomonadota bacterium]